MIQWYTFMQFTALALSFVLLCHNGYNTFVFSLESYLGRVSVYDEAWPQIMKQVNMNQFDEGIIACPTGKYLVDTELQQNWYDVDCPDMDEFDATNLNRDDQTALLWELKKTGVIQGEDVMFGCLNAECAPYLEKGFISHQFVTGACLFNLMILSYFSIGLAAHTMRFDIHYKSLGQEVIALVGMIAVFGIWTSVYLMHTPQVLQTNPESQWRTSSDAVLPSLQEDYAINNSEWYPLNVNFQISESCDGLQKATCLALDYRINIQATSGQLKLRDQELESVQTELNLEGTYEEVNQMLKNTVFLPECDGDPGIQNIVLSAYAWGSASGVTTATKLKPEGVYQKVVGTNEQRFYFASHQQNVFKKDEPQPIYGRVQDMSGKNILPKNDDQLSIIIEQAYGKCTKSTTVPVQNGHFESKILPISDNRSFYTKIKLVSQEYVKIEQNYPVANFMQGQNMFVNIQTVGLDERILGGMYNFRVIDALTYEPISGLTGTYQNPKTPKPI